MAPLTHFQTPITAKPLTQIERNQLREPQAMSGYHLGTTWGPKKIGTFYQSVRLGEKAIYRTIFPICTFLPTGLSAKGKEEYIMACFPSMGNFLPLHTLQVHPGVHLGASIA